MAQPVKVLLVEDNDTYASYVAKTLGQSRVATYEITRATTLDEGLRILASHPPDVLLLDLILPDSTPLGSLARATRAAPDCPIVVLTAVDDDALGVEAMRHGAQDYLVKTAAVGEILHRAIRQAIERKRVEAELIQARIARPLVRALLTSVLERSELHETELRAMGHDLARGVTAATIPGFADAYGQLGLAASLEALEASDSRFTFRGHDLVEVQPGSRRSHCYLTLGFLEGAVRRVTSSEALGTEVACQSRGDPACLFHIQRRESL